MQKIKPLSVFTSFMILILSGIIPNWVRSQEAGPPQDIQRSEASTLREETIKTASRPDLFDCGAYRPNPTPILPSEQQIFQIVSDVKITPDDGKEYWGSIWSPEGDTTVFGVWTGELREIPESSTLLSSRSNGAVPVAVTVHRLMLFSLISGMWEEITSDGTRPTWSRDGQSLYYLAGGLDLTKVDLRTRKKSSTGLGAADTGVGLMLSQPLSDGRLLAPTRSDGPLEIHGSMAPSLSLGGVVESDVIKLSPREDWVAIGYSAVTTEPITVIHNLHTGDMIPLFKNCHYSVVQLAWSPSGDRLAYPVHADPPEIRTYQLASGRTQVLVRLDTFDHLSGLSWSPDGKYLAFARSAGRPESSIWLVSTDGAARQCLVDGGQMPNWSPDRKHILYAQQQESGQPVDWHLLEVQPTEKGGQSNE